MKATRKCYLYTRVSTSMQVDGYSLDAQKDKLRKFAGFQEMQIMGEYSDDSAILGPSQKVLIKRAIF